LTCLGVNRVGAAWMVDGTWEETDAWNAFCAGCQDLKILLIPSSAMHYSCAAGRIPLPESGAVGSLCPASRAPRTQGRTDGLTDRQPDRLTDGLTDRQSGRRQGEAYGQTDRRTGAPEG
ncbi:unnamed protein product, partial [Lampetra fluviatilis]